MLKLDLYYANFLCYVEFRVYLAYCKVQSLEITRFKFIPALAMALLNLVKAELSRVINHVWGMYSH